jgi:hypothetical protein
MNPDSAHPVLMITRNLLMIIRTLHACRVRGSMSTPGAAAWAFSAVSSAAELAFPRDHEQSSTKASETDVSRLAGAVRPSSATICLGHNCRLSPSTAFGWP